MSIRLSKATKECNVGLQTAVDFLQKKGFSDVEANPNSKITEEQYQLLITEFNKDKGLRSEVTQLIQQRQEQSKERKASARKAAEEIIETKAPQREAPKILGRIDLGEKRKATKEEPKPAAKVETPKAAAPEPAAK